MNLDLSGKRALVCGSTSGIGRACAVELANLGASVTLAARDKEKLANALNSLPRSGHDTLPVDFSKPAEVQQALAAAADPRRPWLILINNTGGPPPGPALDATPDQLRASLDQNVRMVQLHNKTWFRVHEMRVFGRFGQGG